MLKSLGEKFSLAIQSAAEAAFKGVQDLLGDVITFALENLGDLGERTLRPFTQPLADRIKASPYVPQEYKDLIDEMQTGRSFVWFAPLIFLVGILMVASMIPVVRESLAGPSMLSEYESHRASKDARLDPSVGARVSLRRPELEDLVSSDAADLGFTMERLGAFQSLVEQLLPEDLLRQLRLRGEVAEEWLNAELKKAGWTEERIAALKKLYWIIPGTQDLIRMAVREAFTPYAIDRYDLGKAFPPEFAEWAAKQGLSADWAKRYWYAHWVLPSITQGYEMLHRGVIDEATLRDLLTYADVLPWWHDKIIAISYRPFTRVDVRRMYGVGVLDRAGVKRAYLDLGYDDTRAEAMTEFTLRYTVAADKDLSKTDILSGYRKGVLSEDDARELLAELGYDEDEVEFFLARESLQETERLRELTLSHIKSLALSGIIDMTQTTAMLADKGYSAEDIERLYALWAIEAAPKDRLPSRTDLANFYEAGIIDTERWIEEMWKLGYVEEYIAWYFTLMEGET